MSHCWTYGVVFSYRYSTSLRNLCEGVIVFRRRILLSFPFLLPTWLTISNSICSIRLKSPPRILFHFIYIINYNWSSNWNYSISISLFLLHSWLPNYDSCHNLFYSIPRSLIIDEDYFSTMYSTSTPILFTKTRQSREILIVRVSCRYIEKYFLVLFGHTGY